MNRSSVACCALLSALLIVANSEAAKRPPNVVVFLVDDMGWNDTAPYGNTFHETPNVTKLAKQGMRFTNAYAACPVCSPTRVSIMTGRYPARVGITDFIPGHLRPWAKLVVPPIHNQLPLSEVSLAEMVKPAGYVTGSFGKWHLGGRTHYPDKQGFDDWIVTGGRHFAPQFRTTPKVKVEKNEYLGDFLTRHAERFIEKNRDKPFLLYLPHYAVHIPLQAKKKLVAKYRKKRGGLMGFPSRLQVRVRWEKYNDAAAGDLLTHLNAKANRPLKMKVRGDNASTQIRVAFNSKVSIDRVVDSLKNFISTKMPKEAVVEEVRVTSVNNPTYAAMVEHIDQSLGRIMQKLDELKLADNTVVIFFSDNGGLYQRFDKNGPAVMSNHPLRDEKGSLYEGGIREPCIIRWPGVVKPGTVSDVPVTSVDFWPTIAEIAGTGGKFKHAIDGVSLLPLLKASANSDSGDFQNPRNLRAFKNRGLYWHYPHYHHTTPGGAIRHGDYKLIEYFEDGKLKLYNLKKDLGETTDLSKQEPKKTKQLHAMLRAWRKSVGAKMPTKNKYYDPKREGEWRSRRRFQRKAGE